jgi:4-hydroxy-3-methylbut-2-enyl diphosphate reductase
MRVLVTFAVDAEFAPWRKRRQFQRRSSRTPSYASASYFSTFIDSVEVVAFITGIALRKSEPGLGFLLEQSIDVCVCAGLAGGLSPSLKAGEIVVADAVTEFGKDSTRLCSQYLVEIAAGMGATRLGRMLTSRSVLGQAQSKREAAAYADAVDMESFDVVTKASDKSIPATVIRAISDTCDEELPLDFDRASNSRGEISASRMALQLFARPQKISAAIAFGKQSAQAAANLANFLDRYIPAVRHNMSGDKAAIRQQVSA